jgi:hypothetical protein
VPPISCARQQACRSAARRRRYRRSLPPSPRCARPALRPPPKPPQATLKRVHSVHTRHIHGTSPMWIDPHGRCAGYVPGMCRVCTGDTPGIRRRWGGVRRLGVELAHCHQAGPSGDHYCLGNGQGGDLLRALGGAHTWGSNECSRCVLRQTLDHTTGRCDWELQKRLSSRGEPFHQAAGGFCCAKAWHAVGRSGLS